MVCLRLEVRRSQARSKLESPSGILRGYICCRRKPKALVAAEIRAARGKRGNQAQGKRGNGAPARESGPFACVRRRREEERCRIL